MLGSLDMRIIIDRGDTLLWAGDSSSCWSGDVKFYLEFRRRTVAVCQCSYQRDPKNSVGGEHHDASGDCATFRCSTTTCISKQPHRRISSYISVVPPPPVCLLTFPFFILLVFAYVVCFFLHSPVFLFLITLIFHLSSSIYPFAVLLKHQEGNRPKRYIYVYSLYCLSAEQFLRERASGEALISRFASSLCSRAQIDFHQLDIDRAISLFKQMLLSRATCVHYSTCVDQAWKFVALSLREFKLHISWNLWWAVHV